MDLRLAHMHNQFPHSIIRSFESLSPVTRSRIRLHVPAKFHTDLIDKLNFYRPGGLVTEITVYLFPLIGMASSIPVYSIIVRYNLIENKICNKFWANMWAVVFPWVMVVPFYSGGLLTILITWSSLVVNSAVNFIIPPIIFIRAKRDSKNRQKLADLNVNDVGAEPMPTFRAVPKWMGNDIVVAWSMVAILSVLTLVSIGYQIYITVHPVETAVH
jgi:hypothetical protein